MPYYRQRRRTRGYRPRGRFSRARTSYARPRRRRVYSGNRGRNTRVVRGRRRMARQPVRRRTARPRTIRIVVQTVSASPTSLGVKGNQPTRAVF